MRNGHGPRQLIGQSPALRELNEEIDRVAGSDAKVLLTGESGVGKELVAHAIHARGRRAQRPFVAVNCAGIPETLLESELFGHVKGSFTGAYRDRPGNLEQADTGTIFLDEIGEMTLRMQGLLLRFLETGDIQKVGAHRAAGKVDVRVVAATNRNLRDLISTGQFREDLFFRLNVIHIHVPPLRERKEDIPILVQYFLDRFSRANGSANGEAARGNGDAAHGPANGAAVRTLSPEASTLLSEYAWPGNVRELENLVERMIVRARGQELTVDDLPMEIRAQHGVAVRPKRERRRTVADDLYKRLVEDRESFWAAVYPLYMQREITRTNLRELIHKGLEETRGNYKIVARMFNMEPTDYKRFLNFLRKHDCQLPFKDYRRGAGMS